MLGLSAVTVTSCGDMLDNESEHFIYADKGHLKRIPINKKQTGFMQCI